MNLTKNEIEVMDVFLGCWTAIVPGGASAFIRG